MTSSTRTRVLVTTSSFAAQDARPKQLLEQAGVVVSENPWHRTLTELEVRDLLRVHQPAGLLAGVEPLTAAVLKEAASSLRVISRCGTGTDTVDVAAAAALGMAVYHTPEAPAQAVAELTVGLMLSLARRIPSMDRTLKAGVWKKATGVLLREWTIGIIGLGRIGKRVALLARAFDAPVIAHDVQPDRRWAKTHGIQLCSKEELLQRADLVTLHTAVGPGKIPPLIGATELAHMRAGSFLVNTARGNLIDDAALVEALRTGHLAGAALDTFAVEPYAGPLRTFEQVILTPHIGSAAHAARAHMEYEAAEHLLEGLRRCGALPRRALHSISRRQPAASAR